MRIAVLGNQVEVAGLNVGEVAGSPAGVRMLVQGGLTRSPFAPDAPTFKEAGLDVTMSSERGIVVAKGTPADIIARLREVTRILSPATHVTFPTGIFVFPASPTEAVGVSMVQQRYLTAIGLATIPAFARMT